MARKKGKLTIVVPDTLISKITSIRTTLKRKVYTYKISELHSPVLSGNTHTYVLPTEVKSEGSLSDKISASYPFTILLQTLTKLLRTRIAVLLIIFLSMFCIICFTLFMRRFITQISQKKNYKKSTAFLQNKKTHYLLISFAFLFLLLYPILWPNQINIKYFLFILLFISFALQRILNIRKSYVLYLVKVILITFICFEIIFGLLNLKKNHPIAYNKNILIKDSLLGWRLRPNCYEYQVYKMLGNDTLYHHYVTSDTYGRRTSKESFSRNDNKTTGLKKKHAIFLGCSITFGEGLYFGSTIPFLFEYFNNDYKSYNYGVSNYGPHQLCLLFNEGINKINNLTIPEDSGFCIYTYMDDHMNRVYGGSEYLTTGGISPDVYINNNEIVYSKRSSIQKKAAWLLNNSETMKYFNIQFRYPKTENFYKRFAGIINYTANKYWEIKPHSEFYIGMYPLKYCVEDTLWIRFLEKRIKVLHVLPPDDYDTNPSYQIKNEGHPTKELNLYYVEEISKLIFKNK